MNNNRLSPLATYFGRILPTIYVCAIYGGPAALLLVAVDVLAPSTLPERLALLFVAPILYSAGAGIIGGVLSRFHRNGVIPGRFPRRLDHPIYAQRRLYGICWTCIYYFSPVYFVILSIRPIKTIVFRLYGYMGSMDFIIYPDSWIRDLPLLDFGPGAYVANRATLGTNMPLSNGTIWVAPIRIGASGVVGHLAELGPGVTVGQRSEIGTRSAIGAGCVIAADVSIGPDVSLEHGVRVGSGAKLKACSRVGLRAAIAPGQLVEFGQVVPPRSASRHAIREQSPEG